VRVEAPCFSKSEREKQGHVTSWWGHCSCMVATPSFHRARGGQRCGQGGVPI
jgi:hypothetical protein